MPDVVDPATGVVTAQPEMPGLPPKRPGIWPDVQTLSGRERVYVVELGFAGGVELRSRDTEAEWIAQQVALGKGLVLEVSVQVDRTGHRLEKGQAIGVAKATVWDVIPAGEEGVAMVVRENRRLRDKLDSIEAAVARMNGELWEHFGKAGPPADMAKAWATLRQLVEGAQ